jgi:Holliday junction resolvase RusA-like endonuclease
MSINAYYYATKRMKTVAAVAYEKQFMELVEDYRKELNDMAEEFKEKGGTFSIDICLVYPSFIFYNKSGTISSKTFDITNCEKNIVDLIFHSCMDVNDKYLVEMRSAKIAGATYEIRITLELLPSE